MNNWKEILKNFDKNMPSWDKNIYPAYVQIDGDKQNTVFDYVNDSKSPEVIYTVLLTTEGKEVPGSSPKEFKLKSGEVLRIDMREWLKEIGIESFIGSLFMFQRYEGTPSKEAKARIRTVMSGWHGGNFHAQIGVGGFSILNVPGKKERQNFFMFNPSVICSDNFKSQIVLCNYSTDPEYTDVVILTPVLNEMNGTMHVGKDVHIQPFGTCVLDIEKHFGEHLFKRGSRYSLSVGHNGHVLSSLFFEIGRNTGDIITGRHTQPPSGMLRPIDDKMLLNTLRSYIPFFDIPVDLLKWCLGKKSATESSNQHI